MKYIDQYLHVVSNIMLKILWFILYSMHFINLHNEKIFRHFFELSSQVQLKINIIWLEIFYRSNLNSFKNFFIAKIELLFGRDKFDLFFYWF